MQRAGPAFRALVLRVVTEMAAAAEMPGRHISLALPMTVRGGPDQDPMDFRAFGLAIPE